MHSGIFTSESYNISATVNTDCYTNYNETALHMKHAYKLDKASSFSRLRLLERNIICKRPRSVDYKCSLLRGDDYIPRICKNAREFAYHKQRLHATRCTKRHLFSFFVLHSVSLIKLSSFCYYIGMPCKYRAVGAALTLHLFARFLTLVITIRLVGINLVRKQ